MYIGVLGVKPDAKRPLGRPGLKWENTTRMDLRETDPGVRDWTDLAQNTDH
jgi:hypothetical protein